MTRHFTIEKSHNIYKYINNRGATKFNMHPPMNDAELNNLLIELCSVTPRRIPTTLQSIFLLSANSEARENKCTHLWVELKVDRFR